MYAIKDMKIKQNLKIDIILDAQDADGQLADVINGRTGCLKCSGSSDSSALSYDISGLIPFHSYASSNQLKYEAVRRLLLSYAHTAGMLIASGIPEHAFCFDTEYLYIDPKDGGFKFLCLPVNEKQEGARTLCDGLREFALSLRTTDCSQLIGFVAELTQNNDLTAQQLIAQICEFVPITATDLWRMRRSTIITYITCTAVSILAFALCCAGAYLLKLFSMKAAIISAACFVPVMLLLSLALCIGRMSSKSVYLEYEPTVSVSDYPIPELKPQSEPAPVSDAVVFSAPVEVFPSAEKAAPADALPLQESTSCHGKEYIPENRAAAPADARSSALKIEAADIESTNVLFGRNAAAPDNAYLISSDGRRTPLTDEVVIGRSTACDLHINDTSISRRHAIIKRIPGGYTIVDCNSRNQTRINGVVLVPGREHQLRDGDTVTFSNRKYIFRKG